MRILLIDNYDSFTYNLVHLLEQFPQAHIQVVRNDELQEHSVNPYDAVVLSPGPGLPKEAGGLLDFIRKQDHNTRLLGVCLGHQAIVEAFGGVLINLGEVKHGVALPTFHTGNENLFRGIPSPFLCGRYHSWVADPKHFPADLTVLAHDNEQNIMAFKHKTRPVYGLQFHPESILTEYGKELIFNWLSS